MANAKRPTTVDEYLASLPSDRREAIQTVRAEINRRLPAGYREGMAYGMIGWCVPKELYPAGYPCDPSAPLPFAGLASQKSHMSLHLMPVYGSPPLRERFEAAWKKTGKRLDMGKACIRFKRVEDVALDVIGDTVASIPVDTWVKQFEDARRGRTGKPAGSKGSKRKGGGEPKKPKS